MKAGINAIALVLVLTVAGSAQVADPAAGFSAFRLLRARNIFDAERRGQRSETPATSAQPTATSRPNFIALTGTMVTDARSLAFFTGSQPDHSKVIAVGDKIAEFTVTGITPAQVDLEQSGKTTALGIGRQLTLAGFIVEAAAPAPGSPSADAVPTSPRTTAPPPAAGDKNDVLRRMMERRQKENQK